MKAIMSSQVSRVLANPFKHYLMGYVAGITLPDGIEDLLMEDGTFNTWAKGLQMNHPKVFSTPEKAKEAAEKIESKSPRFYRAYQYSSPKDQDLPLWPGPDKHYIP